MISLEKFKAELRREHAMRDSALVNISSTGTILGARLRGMDAYHSALDDARKFWSLYEKLNRSYAPEDPVYSIARTAVTAAAATDLVTIQTLASRKWRLLEVICGSEGTASAACRHVWQVSTGGTTETAGNVPEKFDIDSPASMFGTADIVNGWAAQPTLSGQPKVAWAYNALGGYYDWKAAPGAEVYHRNSEQVSYRSVVGTAVLSFTIVEEEM